MESQSGHVVTTPLGLQHFSMLPAKCLPIQDTPQRDCGDRPTTDSTKLPDYPCTVADEGPPPQAKQTSPSGPNELPGFWWTTPLVHGKILCPQDGNTFVLAAEEWWK